MKLTNKNNLPLSIAIWLAHDSYEYSDDPYQISATSLLKPIKQLVLAKRNAPKEMDVMDLYNVRIGTAIHDSIENAWLNGFSKAADALALPEHIKQRICINNAPQGLQNLIPVNLEHRASKKIGKWTVTGKFDTCIEGQLEDNKSITYWGYKSKSNIPDYQMQGGIYRWLNEYLVTAPTIQINYFIKDWRKSETYKDSMYPTLPIQVEHYPLPSLADTEFFIKDKLYQIEKYMDVPEEQMPPCSDKELWRTDPVYKYYKKPGSPRSTANRSTMAEAIAVMQENNNVGEIVTVPGKVKRCLYCSAMPYCKQKDAYLLDGSLELEE